MGNAPEILTPSEALRLHSEVLFVSKRRTFAETLTAFLAAFGSSESSSVVDQDIQGCRIFPALCAVLLLLEV